MAMIQTDGTGGADLACDPTDAKFGSSKENSGSVVSLRGFNMFNFSDELCAATPNHHYVPVNVRSLIHNNGHGLLVCDTRRQLKRNRQNMFYKCRFINF